MAIPQILSFSSGSDSAKTTSRSVGMPSGIQQGDLLIGAIYTSGSVDPNPPTGWNLITTSTPDGTLYHSHIMKYAGVSEPSSLTITTDVSQKCAWSIFRFNSESVYHFTDLLAGSPGANENLRSTYVGNLTNQDVLGVCFIGLTGAVGAINSSSASTGSFTPINLTSNSGPALIAQYRAIPNMTSNYSWGSLTNSAGDGFIDNQFLIVNAQSGAFIEKYNAETNFGNSGFGDIVGNITGYAQSFTGSGKVIKEFHVDLGKTGTVTGGIITASIYTHSGSFDTTGVPTGSALAISTTTITATVLPTSTDVKAPYKFAFDYQTIAGTSYVIAIECGNLVGSGTPTIRINNGSQTGITTGNTSEKVSGVWTVRSDNDMALTIISLTSGSSSPGVILRLSGARKNLIVS